MPCVAEVVNRSLKADCTNYTKSGVYRHGLVITDDGGYLFLVQFPYNYLG